MAGDIFLLGTHSWQIRRVEPGVVRVRDAGDARPPSRSGWARRRPAPPSCRPRCPALRAAVDEYLAAGDPDGARAWLRRVGRDRRRRRRDDRRLPRGRARGARRDAHAGAARARALLRRDRRHAARACTPPTAGASTARSGSRCARSSAARSTSSCRPRRPTTRSCSRSARTTASRSQEVPRYVQQRDGRGHARARDPRLADVPGPLALEPQPRRSWSCASATGGATRRRSSAWRPTTSWPRCSRRRRRARRTSPARSRSPTTSSCARPSTTRCTRRSTSTALRELLERIESGEVTVHCVDTTEPSVLAHEILTARPYAFLDDEELQNRRTNAVHAAARASRSTSASIGALDPDAIEQVHDEITPEPDDGRRPPRPACARSWSPGPRPSGGRCSTSSRRAGARPGARARRRATLWCTTETHRRRGARARRRRGRGRRGAARPPRDHRGHHRRRRSPTPPRCTPGGSRAGLAVARARRLRAAGPLPTADAADSRVGARRLLARMHSYSRRTRRRGRRTGHRAGLHALPAALAARRARHPARRRGRAARRARPAPGLRGGRGRRGSPSCSAPAARYDAGVARPAVPRRRGRLAAPHAARRDDADAPAGAPSKATPISVVFRADLAWLLAARARSAPTRRADGRRDRRGRSRCCASAARASPPSSAPPPTGCPRTSSAPCGTAWPAACSPSDGFGAVRARMAGGKRTQPTSAASRACARGPRPAPPRPAAGRSCRHRSGDATDLRPRRAGRGGGRAAAAPVGRRVPRPRRARLAALPVARAAVGAAPARGPRARAGRPLRHRLQRRAVRAARGASSSSPRSARLPATGERVTRQRHRPAQPGRGHRARGPPSRRSAPAGSSTSTASPRVPRPTNTPRSA